MGELAERLQIRHHSAVGLVDRLVSGGLLIRQPDPEDRRKVHVMLTEGGEALLEALSHSHRAELVRTGPELQSLLQALSSGETA